MPPLPDTLTRYRRQRSISGPWTLEGDLEGHFNACIVIPALAESLTLPQTLASLSKNSVNHLQQTLIVVVVNQRSDVSESLRHDNHKTLYSLRNSRDKQIRLAWVDASTPGLELPAKGGVGLARKIGFDLCLPLLNWEERPFLVSLDADTEVHSGYLESLYNHFAESNVGAAVIPFKHRAIDKEKEDAIRRYELYLRSYAFGLFLAGSPYAYISIGSAFACRADAYIQAGGMNRRQAGEDFYFLQQLCKVTGICEVKSTAVYPSSRISERVPFGTGRVVQAQTTTGTTPYTFCDCTSFKKLKQWLDLITAQWQASAQRMLSHAEQIDPRFSAFLNRLNFCDVWSQLQRNHSDKARFISNFHCWFDGLRTRQLLTILTTVDALAELDLINELLSWGGHPVQISASDQLEQFEVIQGVPPYL